jgi:outer membrane usher protein
MIVNGVPKGEVLVVLRDADALIGVGRLNTAGMRGFEGTRETIGNDELVSLASLAPAVTYVVNERDLTVTLTAPPELLGETRQDLATGAPAHLVYRSDASGFVNYAVNWGQGGSPDLFAESAARLGGALLYNTVSIVDRTTTRGLTSVTFDNRRAMTRWIVGDAFASTGALGGDAWTGGITVGREFGIEPYFVRHPSLSLSTPIVVPSVVEVHVNGRLVSQQQVEPGRLDMRNLPLTVGRNDARVVVRDAFGVSREIATGYYLASSVLAKGVHDYQYSLGFRRDEVGSASWNYKAPVALTRHRVGLTDTVTLGGRLELSEGLASGGPSINLSLPIGEVEGAAAMSGGREGTGGAALAAFTYSGQPVSAGGSILVSSAGYATVNARPLAERSAMEVSLFASMPLAPRISLTLQHSYAALHGAVTRGRSALLTTAHLQRHLQLSVTAALARDEYGRSAELYAGVTVLFGRGSASVANVHDRRGSSVVVEAQQPLPVGEGYGFHARAETGSPSMFNGGARYQGRYGRYEVRRDVIGGQGISSVSATGALVAIGGGVYASRPVQDSFALVQVPGIEGVRGYASNQEIGRTDRSGNLLIPDLQAYYGNLLQIADSDIPFQYSVGGVGLTLAPPYRGGARAVFPVQRLQRIMGTVRIAQAGEERIPEYGEIILAAGAEPLNSPVGSTGDFYFENLAPGRYPARVQDGKGACDFVLDVPAATDPLVQLGTIRCTIPEAR